MEYEMEELVPIVGRLAEKYTGFESSSITYEKAEQLMGAVLYCIREAQSPERRSVAAQGGLPARQAYETGLLLVEEKVKAALGLFNEMLPRFAFYGNRCLQDTFVKGLPEFFKWYDIRFNPQDTVAALDYPVLKDLSGYTGIDKIYEYIRCIRLEQEFLGKFPESYVVDALSKRDDFYQDMVENICEVVFVEALGHVLAGKPLMETDFEEEDYRRVRELLSGKNGEEVRRLLEDAAEAFAAEHCGEDGELKAYLMGTVGETAVRMKNAAQHGSLCHLF